MIACGILRKEIEHLVKAGEIDAKGKTEIPNLGAGDVQHA